MSDLQPVPVLSDDTTYCEKHPDRETSLRCNKCGRLMCIQCAVQTPVGYRCRECVRGIEDKYFTANSNDSLLIFASCAGVGAFCAVLASVVSLGLFITVILGLPIGGALAEIPIRLVQKRRGRNFPEFGVAGTLVGGVVGILVHFFLFSSFRQLPAEVRNAVLGNILTSYYLGPLLLVGIVAAAVYGRLRMRG